ncbi:MAG: DedA family protein [Pirellulales bacterium]
MVEQLIQWYTDILEQWGFFAVALLMAAESTVLPIPSEVVVPPAAYQAWSGNGLQLFGVNYTGWTAQTLIVLASTIGSWVGASIMYWVSRSAGRPLVMKFGKYVMISEAKIEGAERWAAAYGSFGIFAARLLPVVRHLIGIPAGIVRMNFVQYSIYTILGSALWTVVLCWLGINVGGHITKGEMHKVTYWVLGFLAILGLLYYVFVYRHMKKGSAEASAEAAQ